MDIRLVHVHHRKVKNYSINKSDLTIYYNVRKILSEAGKHYGEGVIKEYSKKINKYLYKNSIDFDFVISIEGGYEKIDEKYFIVTYASILDHNVCEYLGKSIGLEITPAMFEWVKKGNSLNKVIESIVENENNKKKNGISGYLTNGLYKRDVFDSSAVQSALIKMNNSEIYENLDREIKKLIKY